ncbi:deferrochelatase/peroxidase EfeB [Paracoccus suum]|uniref:Deferrochelatase n=1 Tax=Paracoccus suum TaxID=2259340 RepID=A0A344PMR7_9RHOB|nr:iron uptake transporter deferrochelatase/peroxidase subunit [Paracoccus suum]AXC50672.1 deferrochelatase/peroxidase EfeB [Paracoccus suum]
MGNETPKTGLQTSRRGVLGAMGLLAACPFAGMARAQTPAGATPEPPVHSVTDAPEANRATQGDHVSPYGPHQAGITTARPAHGMIASFDLIAETPDELEETFKRLTSRIAFLTAGGPVPQLDPGLPPADSGILGPVLHPDALTITVSLGASLFDRLDWLTPHRPACLSRMTSFPNDALDAQCCHGDLSLQICANTQDTTIHALRDVLKTMSDRLVLNWKQEGSVPVIARTPDGVAESARNFLGFRDGSANPDSGDSALMDRIVWVGSGGAEPAWATGGTYQAVRLIRNFVERWDRTPFAEQEAIFGRRRISGAPLDRPDGTEFDVPDYAADRDGARTPLDSHIRLANPRGPGDEASLILRRPFNYSAGVTRSGQLDQGLLFICYQADLDRGFIAVQNRLNGEPLEEYIKPTGGGYFFTLPGMRDADDYLGRTLIAALRAAPVQTATQG